MEVLTRAPLTFAVLAPTFSFAPLTFAVLAFLEWDKLSSTGAGAILG